MDEKLVNRIICVAYGEASLWEKIKIYKLAKQNPKVDTILKEHSRIAQQAHNVNIDTCPDEIIKNVKRITQSKQNKESSLLFDLYSFLFRRPVISGAIFTLFVIALISTLLFKRPEIHQQYSKQEIEVADKQVKHSLALISGVFKKTSVTLEKDILTDRVSKPIKESFNLVNEFIQGDRNENYN